MRFWIREVAGWLLLLLSLMLFYLCYLMLVTHDVTEAWPLAFIGIIVFRGGIQLLKVAVAAHLWAEAQTNEQMKRPSAPVSRVPFPATPGMMLRKANEGRTPSGRGRPS